MTEEEKEAVNEGRKGRASGREERRWQGGKDKQWRLLLLTLLFAFVELLMTIS